jgi:hypothetical protein
MYWLLMGFLARVIWYFGYNRVWYEPIREGFLSWFRQAYEIDEVRTTFENHDQDLVERAVISGQEARNPSKHNRSALLFNVVTEAVASIKFVITVLSIIGISLSVSGFGLLMTESTQRIGATLGISGLALSGIVLSVPSFYYFLSHLIRNNIDFWKRFNKELHIGIGRIRENERKPANLMAFYFWNNSLKSPKTLAIVVILGMIRKISPYTYGIISERLRNDVNDFFYERNLKKKLARDYQEVKTRLR